MWKDYTKVHPLNIIYLCVIRLFSVLISKYLQYKNISLNQKLKDIFKIQNN